MFRVGVWVYVIEQMFKRNLSPKQNACLDWKSMKPMCVSVCVCVCARALVDDFAVPNPK